MVRSVGLAQARPSAFVRDCGWSALTKPKVITDRGKVKELRAAGKSLPTIAREMNLSITTVARICKDAA
jgi:hypothetical protein